LKKEKQNRIKLESGDYIYENVNLVNNEREESKQQEENKDTKEFLQVEQKVFKRKDGKKLSENDKKELENQQAFILQQLKNHFVFYNLNENEL